MANLTDIDSFDAVYQLEKTDDVIAGAGGIANAQAQALANRTKYLADRAILSAAGISAYAVGDLLYATAADQLSRLPIGTPGQVLTVAAGEPVWSDDVTVNNELTVLGQSRLTGDVKITGSPAGVLAIGGDFYNHVLVSVGFGPGGNPLNQPHQVAFYAAHTGNSFVKDPDGFVAGFEAAISVDCGGSCNAATAYQVAQITVAAGSTVTCTRGLGTHDQIYGINNAAIADNGAPFTGNWFIYYPLARPSYLGGLLHVVGDVTCDGQLHVAGNVTLGPEISQAVDTQYTRIWGGTDGLGAFVLIGGDAFSAGNRRTISISTSSPSAPTGGDGTIEFITQGGTTVMDRTAVWTFPAGVVVENGLTLVGFGGGTGVVTVGAVDSGGAGYRALRVPN